MIEVVLFTVLIAILAWAGWKNGSATLAVMAGFVGFLPAFFATLLSVFGDDRWLEAAMFWTAGGILAASSRIRARSE